MPESTHSKRCYSCQELKPLEEFHRYSRTLDGRQYKCRKCRSAYQQQYNREHGATRATRRLAQALANPDRDRAAKRAWDDANPERRAEIAMPRRARRSETSVGPIDLDLLWTGRCGICLKSLDRDLSHPDPLSKSVDHIVALSRGGAHAQDNLQWSHLICNLRKGVS
ncbi:MAG: hypothetical protein JWQ77_2321 [Jatrophihabitans sp.]|nr:hypothetical protein [Jatrophihabitans sp.]